MCVCVCVRACVRACVCFVVGKNEFEIIISLVFFHHDKKYLGLLKYPFKEITFQKSAWHQTIPDSCLHTFLQQSEVADSARKKAHSVCHMQGGLYKMTRMHVMISENILGAMQSHQTNTNIRQLNKQTENVAGDIQCGHRLLTWTIEPPLWLQFINEVLGTVQQLSVNNNCFNKYQTKWIISSDKESQNSAGKVHGYLCTCQFCFGNQWIILILIILIVILY